MTLYRSMAVSSGGVGKPPSMPAWIRGMRVPSRNFSQPGDGWSPWTVNVAASCTAWSMAHSS